MGGIRWPIVCYSHQNLPSLNIFHSFTLFVLNFVYTLNYSAAIQKLLSFLGIGTKQLSFAYWPLSKCELHLVWNKQTKILLIYFTRKILCILLYQHLIYYINFFTIFIFNFVTISILLRSTIHLGQLFHEREQAQEPVRQRHSLRPLQGRPTTCRRSTGLGLHQRELLWWLPKTECIHRNTGS